MEYATPLAKNVSALISRKMHTEENCVKMTVVLDQTEPVISMDPVSTWSVFVTVAGKVMTVTLQNVLRIVMVEEPVSLTKS